MTIAEYLESRAGESLTAPDKLATVIPDLAAIGAEIDGLLTRAEGVKALASRAEAGQFEQTVQTLGARSREIWIAHTAAITVAQALKQLTDVEAALKANLAP